MWAEILQLGCKVFITIFSGGMAVVLCSAVFLWFYRKLIGFKKRGDSPNKPVARMTKDEDVVPFVTDKPEISSSFDGERIGRTHESRRS